MGFKCIYKGGVSEIEEKKSRFICYVEAVESETAAVAFINEIKKKHWDARHNCSAFVIGDKGQLTRCSDDGEPQGTAGRPMLEVLLGENIRNVAVVVTRYFGGILLGTGGLVRAYQAAVKEGLRASVIVEKQLGVKAYIESDYTDYGKLSYLYNSEGYYVINTDFAENVRTELMLNAECFDEMYAKVIEITAGRIAPIKGEECLFGVVDKEVVIFEKSE